MKKNQKNRFVRLYTILLILILALNIFIPMFHSNRMENTSYSNFLTQVEKKKVKEVQVDGDDDIIYYTLKNDDIWDLRRWRAFRWARVRAISTPRSWNTSAAS